METMKLTKLEPKKIKVKLKILLSSLKVRRLEKLGGSIAFVMKSNKFLWDGGEDAQ